jgi:hypothetical protein
MAETWFDTRFGELLIGEAAYQGRVDGSFPGDIVPLGDLLLADEFPVDRHEFRSAAPAEWSKEDTIALGASTLRLLREVGHEGLLTKEILLRLYHLGVGFSPDQFIGTGKVFPSVQGYRNEVGDGRGRSPGQFQTWTTEDFVAHAAKVEAAAGGRPKKRDYIQFAAQNRDAPSIHIISRHVPGGISTLHEHLGYANTKTWTEDDFITFGGRFIEVNGLSFFSNLGIVALSAKGRGPGYASIIERFGTWNSYKEQVFSEYREQLAAREAERQAKLENYRALIAGGDLPAGYADLPDDVLLRYGAHYRVSLQLVPALKRGRRLHIIEYTTPGFVKALIGCSKTILTAGDIELEASILDVYEDLWPMTQYKTHLKVTEEEITQTTGRRDEVRRRRLRTQL